jgi:Nitrogen regulatory protein PII
MTEFKLICCVVNMGDASKLLKIARKYGVKESVISIGRGTLNSKLLAFLKINEIRKEIVSMLVEKELSAEAIKGISREMAFEKPHHGIAFSFSVDKFMGGIDIDKEKVDKNIQIQSDKVEKNMYNIIYVIVEKGKAEDVMDAAAKAGSKGGTIINARGAGTHEVQKLFSLEIEPEREEVIIITKAELKPKVVESIRNDLKMDVPGNGVMFVLELDEVYGLHLDN